MTYVVGPGLSMARRFNGLQSPDAIHEGSVLGYALDVPLGAVMDKPDLVVTCVVGDGEAETGPTATAWHG